ncbi:MAG TPA: hypothetical protein VMT20_30105 [Terriglobia bacterium]|nr:hypothetical protein [Terriglobia bacterium]
MRQLFAMFCFLTTLAHGQSWTQLGPAARYGHTTVFDPITATMIVFGGTDSAGPYNDAWASTAFESSSHNLKWTQVLGSSALHPSSDPETALTRTQASTMLAPPRAYSPAVFWAAQNQIILWGGMIYVDRKDWIDSHEFNLNLTTVSWTHDGPRSRQAHTAVYDPDTNSMIIFGGSHSTSFGPINDTFLTSVTDPNESWQGVKADLKTGPPPVYGHVAGFNASNRVMVTATGATGTGQLAPCLNGVWQLANANMVGTPSWSQPVVSGTPPSARAFAASIYDSVSDSLTIVGGADCNGNYLQDVWTLHGATGTSPSWSHPTVQNGPPPREGATAVYDPNSNVLILFGGDEGAQNYWKDVWTLSNANGAGSGKSTWTELNPIGPGPAGRSGHWAVYNATTGTMYIGDGNSTSGMLSDTWQLTGANGLGGAPVWTQLITTGSFQSRQATAILAGSSVVTFGGQVPAAFYFSPTYDLVDLLAVN